MPVRGFRLALAAGAAMLALDAARAQQPQDAGMLRGTTAPGMAIDVAPDGASQLDQLAPPLSDAPNYGKPRKPADPRAKYSGKGKRAKTPLPPLTPYATSAQARQKRATPGQDDPPGPPPSVAAPQPIPRKAPPRIDSDPFGPIGIGVGGLRLVPYVEVDTGYDSNPNRQSGATTGSWTARGETGFSLKSDWSNHLLTGSGELGYSRYFAQPNADRPDGQGKFDLRLDVTRDTTMDFELRGALSTSAPGTPGVGVAVVNRPLTATFGATAGGAKSFGDLSLGLHGLIDRSVNENGLNSDGTTADLANANYTAFGVQPRVAYQITPGVIPFADATIDTRKRDTPLDLFGLNRDSTGLAARVGSTFELSRMLTGQIAVGYAQREYAATQLKKAAAPTIDAALIWTATPLTTVTLKAATAINETTEPNSPGAVNHTGSVEISHALLRNLTLGAVGALSVNDYQGVNLRETTLSATLKADYILTRSVIVRGSFTHERLQSTTPGSDYTANVFLLGLKLQR